MVLLTNNLHLLSNARVVKCLYFQFRGFLSRQIRRQVQIRKLKKQVSLKSRNRFSLCSVGTLLLGPIMVRGRIQIWQSTQCVFSLCSTCLAAFFCLSHATTRDFKLLKITILVLVIGMDHTLQKNVQSTLIMNKFN